MVGEFLKNYVTWTKEGFETALPVLKSSVCYSGGFRKPECIKSQKVCLWRALSYAAMTNLEQFIEKSVFDKEAEI